MATVKEENIKLAEIAAEITKEMIKANPSKFDTSSSVTYAFQEVFKVIAEKVN